MTFAKFIKDNIGDPFVYIEIIVIGVFIYALISIYINDKKKGEIKKRSADATASILSVRSKPGENSGYVNIEFKVSYQDNAGKNHISLGSSVIDVTDIQKYQPGKEVAIKYIQGQFDNVYINIPNPLLKKHEK